MADVSRALAKLGLSVDEISGRTNLARARVTALLEGASVTPQELRALMSGLRLPARAFSTAGFVAERPGPVVRFRNTRANAEFDPTNERVAAFVDAALKLLPVRDGPPDWLRALWQQPHVSRDDAERLAELIRGLIYHDGLDDPAIGLPQRLNALEGFIVSQLPHSRYEGASVVVSGYIFIFVSPRFSGRMLFTIGHELGHVVANHANGVPHYDKAGDIGRFKNPDEAFADNFASAFLLPGHGLGLALAAVRNVLGISSDAVGDLEILMISRFFGVSFDVAARRFEQLKLLPSGGAFSLSEYMRKNFGNAERRAEEARLPPRQAIALDRISPRLLRAASEKIQRQEVSSSWVADRLGLSIDQLQQEHLKLSERPEIAH